MEKCAVLIDLLLRYELTPTKCDDNREEALPRDVNAATEITIVPCEINMKFKALRLFTKTYS